MCVQLCWAWGPGRLGLIWVCCFGWQEARTAACGCTFCRACLAEYVEGAPLGATCPTCDKPLSVDLSAPTTNAVGPAAVSPLLSRACACRHRWSLMVSGCDPTA